MRSDVMGKTMAILMVMAMIATGIVLFPADVEASGQAYTIRGKVLNNVGDAPLVDVTVNITVHTTPPRNEVVYTIANGTFSKVFMLDGKYNFTIVFTKTGFGNKTGYKEENRTFNTTWFAGNVANTDITLLYPLDLIKGKVLEASTVIPIKDVKVYVNDKHDRETLDILTTDSNGLFSYYTNQTAVNLHFYKNGYYSKTIPDQNVKEASNLQVEMEMISPTPTVMVWGRVRDDEGNRLDGAIVSISPGDEKWITTITDSVGYFEIMTYPGNFQIKGSKTNYKNSVPEWFNVPADKSVRKDLTLVKTPAETRWVSGTTTPPGATLYIHSTPDGQYINSTTSDSGTYNISFYPGSNFVLEVKLDGYFTNVSAQFSANTSNMNFVLKPIGKDHTLSGFVYSADTVKPITDATVTIYSKAPYLYQKSTKTAANGFYAFDAHHGADFWLAVEADGYQSIIEDVDDIDKNVAKDIELTPSGKDTESVRYVFLDWNTIQVTRNSIITVDNVTVRMNADRKFGMGDIGLDVNDGELAAAEIQDWAEHLRQKGLEKRDTKGILTLNNTYYQLNETTYQVAIEGALGPVGADATIYINSTYNNTLVGNVNDLDSDSLTLILNATYDTRYMDYIYEIVLPFHPDHPENPMFEMTENRTETNKATVTGYNDPITIDPMVHDGETETVTMTIERSRNGTAKAKLLSGVHHILNSTYDNYTVIVAKGPSGGRDTTVTFSAADSTDHIGNIAKANFTWDFGDGTMGYGMTAKHNFTGASDKLTVKLVITETGGNKTYRNITVFVDGEDPVARISADVTDSNVTYNSTSRTLTVNEDVPVTFSGNMFYSITDMAGRTIAGAASYDMIAPDIDGHIEKWYWSWGEEDSFDETVTKDGSNNITHTYSKPGKYTLTMFVTDVVGRESENWTWKVIVLDTTAPVPDFKITYTDNPNAELSEVIENKAFQYNASSTVDNNDNLDNLTFEWFFEADGSVSTRTGTVVNFTFDKVGLFNVTLKATDRAGNSQNKTRMVNVNLANRPNVIMMLNSMMFSESPGTAGKAMTISVNITNDGQANATDVKTAFYIRNADGTDTEIGTATTPSLGMGETETASVSWTPKKKGEFTIWANSTSAAEHSSQWWDNKIDDFSVQRITINEAPWVMPAIIISIVAIIVVVFLGMRYFMKSGTKEDDFGDKRKKR